MASILPDSGEGAKETTAAALKDTTLIAAFLVSLKTILVKRAVPLPFGVEVAGTAMVSRLVGCTSGGCPLGRRSPSSSLERKSISDGAWITSNGVCSASDAHAQSSSDMGFSTPPAPTSARSGEPARVAGEDARLVPGLNDSVDWLSARLAPAV